jgi:hypothetical protein
VYEAGLFGGYLSPTRCFIVIPATAKMLRIPSDLLGMTLGRYKDNRSDKKAFLRLLAFVVRYKPPPTIHITIDPRLDKRTAHSLMKTTFQVAVKHHADVKVRIIDADADGEFSPPKPLRLSDFKSASLAQKVFADSGERQIANEGQTRLDAAIGAFDTHFARYAVFDNSCVKLLQAARQLAAEEYALNLLLVTRNICTGPRISVRLPRERRLVVVAVPSNVQLANQDDCSVISEERRLVAIFPQAAIVPNIDADMLAGFLIEGRNPAAVTRVVIHGCAGGGKSSEASGAAVQRRESSTEVDASDPPMGEALRIISPRHHDHVARDVPFQGDGAHPGETLHPIVRVNDEFFPQEPVIARPDGTYDGEVIIGRPSNDCNKTFELRIFGQIRQPLTVGTAIGGWPTGASSSLPVQVTRTEDCGPGGR